MKHKLIFLAVIFVLTAGLLPAPMAAQEASGQDYTVQADDWLSKLADKFYGDVFNWPAIWLGTNNKAAEDDSYATIDNPNIIEVGQKLWIPNAEDAAALLIIRFCRFCCHVVLRSTLFNHSGWGQRPKHCFGPMSCYIPSLQRRGAAFHPRRHPCAQDRWH